MDGPSDLDLAELRVCRDLRGAHVARAMESRQGTIDLLRHLTSISAPRTGTAKVLLVFAWMGTSACEWLEGALHIELRGQQDRTRVDIATDLGGGARERVVPSFVMQAPIEEFWTAIQRKPRIVGTLVVRATGEQRLVLSASAGTRRTSALPPAFQIAPGSLYAAVPDPPRVPTPANREDVEGDDDIDAGWDD